MKTLKAKKNNIADTAYQLEILNNINHIPSFQEQLMSFNHFPLTPYPVEILQVNVGKMCNQVCEHCHVDAGPDREEIMTRKTMQHCLNALKQTPSITTVDLTGGAPEMNPDFQWFVKEIRSLGRQVIVRCNLTILVANKKYRTYPTFFAENNIKVIASLPCYTEENTDKQRGNGVFKKSLEAIKLLNELGYGKENSGLELDFVFNPGGAGLPGDQNKLENDYKRILHENYGIVFNHLYTITNMPISRFLEYLLATEKFDKYMALLANSFNPHALKGLMCRNTLSVSWDGYLYDCDFNQMIDLKVDSPKNQHVSEYNQDLLNQRNIVLGQHCYGCTAGAGSSCQGAITVK